MEIKKILFKGEEWLLVDGFSITKEDDLRNGMIGYAVLEDEGVFRYHKKIAEKDEIKILGKTDVELGINYVAGVVLNALDVLEEIGEKMAEGRLNQ